jgi:hypothetical protein
VATSRHITGGGVDLVDLAWGGGVLSGRSGLVGGDPYEIYVNAPSGWVLREVQCDGAIPLPVELQPLIIKTGCRADRSREIAWRVRFEAE